MTNSLLVGGVALDLDPETRILPSFQVSEWVNPENSIATDFSPQFSVPGTVKNHDILGQAAYGSTTAGIPYRKLRATLLSDGVEIMPFALLYVKGYEDGKYQLQLFGGNKKLGEALGNKTLRDLDFSRFNHFWTLGNIAQRLSLDHWQRNGWGYELYDRGRPIDVNSLNPYICLPSVSARLIWQQILEEAGFTATELSFDPLFAQLNVPAPGVAGYPKTFTEARRFVGGHPELPVLGDKRPAARDPLEYPVPFTFHPEGVDPYRLPTVGGMLVERTHVVDSGTQYPFSVYKPDTACLLTIDARVNVDFNIELGRCRATLSLYKNGQLWIQGTQQEVGSSGFHLVSAGVTATREAVAAGDEIYCVLRLESISLINKWGFYTGLFSGQQFGPFDQPSPLDQFSIEVVSEVPPGGRIVLNEWLPEMRQLDFFVAMVKLLGLTVQCDAYESHLHLGLSVDVFANINRALDWTIKRNAPDAPQGEARNVAFRFGSYGQKNWLRWTDDDTLSVGFQGAPRKARNSDVITQGYGDGYLAVGDTNLPLEASLGVLPFAASENSSALSGGLWIASWKREESNGTVTYEQQQVQPRLTLRSGAPLILVLREGSQTRTTTTSLSYFADSLAQVELDLHRCILPKYWLGLAAMLKEARYLKEQYRLNATDIARLDYTIPIYDAVLGDYFFLSKVAEFSPDRPTEVEMVRLHPTLFAGPSGNGFRGEFYPEEFFAGPEQEFY